MATGYGSCSENGTHVLTWALLQAAPRWGPFARRLSPYNSASPHAWRPRWDATGGDTSTKRERSGKAAGRAPSPESHTKALPTGIPVPSASASGISIAVPVSPIVVWVFLLCSSDFHILLLLPRGKIFPSFCCSFHPATDKLTVRQ